MINDEDLRKYFTHYRSGIASFEFSMQSNDQSNKTTKQGKLGEEEQLKDQFSLVPVPVPNQATKQGKWSEEEHAIFLTAMGFRPRISWKQVAILVGTRSPRQIRTHAQTYLKKLRRQQRQQRETAGYSISIDRTLSSGTTPTLTSKIEEQIVDAMP